MTDFLQAIFLTWEFHPEVLIAPLFFGVLYVLGWLRLRALTAGRDNRPDRDLVSGWRLVSYVTGLALLVLALLSGLDALSTTLFFVHMIQHLLVMMVVPVLLWLGDPYPFILWGLPRSWRPPLSRLMASPSPFRQTLARLTAPGLAIFYLVAALWIWHDGVVYSLALRHEWVHNLEHISFFVTGMIFWWHVTAASPRLHPTMSYLRRSAFAIAPAPFNMVLGVAITFSGVPWYDYYLGVPRVWGVSVMDDQMYGGVIMWLVGTMMFLMAVFVLMALYFRLEEQTASRHHGRWAKGDALLAPDLEGKALGERG